MENYKFLKNNPVDVLVLESTYGNKDAHIPFSDSVNMLEDLLVEGIKKGDVLCVLEAMKMENEIYAPRDGEIAAVSVAKGESVESGKALVVLK